MLAQLKKQAQGIKVLPPPARGMQFLCKSRSATVWYSGPDQMPEIKKTKM